MENSQVAKKSLFYRFLDFVERAGNKLPHPFTMFVYITLGVIGISFVLNKMGIQVQHPTKDEIVVARNLLSAEGVQYMVLNMISNFAGFKYSQ